MYFEPDEQELASFLICRFARLTGPRRMVRFTDSTRGHQAAIGRFNKHSGFHHSYWMYAEDVEDILDEVAGPSPYGMRLIKRASEKWAVCDDWGDMKRVWVLAIPSDKEVNGYCGFAKFQPKISVAAQEATGRRTKNSYPGGGMQFVLGLSEEHKHWIHGPIPTLALSKKKLQSIGHEA